MAVVTEILEDESPSDLHADGSSAQTGESGFFGSLVGSIMEVRLLHSFPQDFP